MAGHSKWAKIARSKGAADARKSLIYSKHAAAISAAARVNPPHDGKLDSEVPLHPRLLSVLERARAAGVPRDVMQRAVSAAQSSASSAASSEIEYHGTLPGGVAVIVECLTDNPKRTAPAMRHVFSKHGGVMGSSVAHLFRREGRVVVDVDRDDASLLDAAVAAGAEDVQFESEGRAVMVCDPTAVATVRASLEAAGVKVQLSEVARVAITPVALPEPMEEGGLDLDAFLTAMEEHPDVQTVTHNVEAPEGEDEQHQALA